MFCSSYRWSDTIILCHEIGPVPIENLPLEFLFRMDIELVKYHHLLVFQVVQWPYLFLTVRGLLCREGRIAGLGELDPHLAHSL